MRLIDVDEVKKQYPIMENDFGMVVNESLHKELDKIPTIEAIPLSVIEEIKADIIEMRKRDPLYYYVATEDILDWVLNTIDRKVKEHET